MTEGSEESNEERNISTAVVEEDRADSENEGDDDVREEAVRLEQLEVQLEEDSDILPNERDDNLSEKHDSGSPEEEEKRKDEDCPFCDFMRLGPCGKSFSSWEKCTEAAEQGGTDVFEQCNVVTGILTACMRANLSYYGPVLEAQKGIDGPLLEAEAMVKTERNTDKNSKRTDEQTDNQAEGAVKGDNEW